MATKRMALVGGVISNRWGRVEAQGRSIYFSTLEKHLTSPRSDYIMGLLGSSGFVKPIIFLTRLKLL